MTKDLHGAYSCLEASTYDSDRSTERLWHLENSFVAGLVRRWAPASILDVPVGTGRFLEMYPSCKLVGADISESMLELATRRPRPADSKKVVLINASIISLPLEDKEFDLVICWRLFHLLPTEMLPQVFSELRRVCKGVLCVQAYTRASFIARNIARSRRHLIRLNSIFRARQQPTPWSHIKNFSHSLEDVVSAARAANLPAPTLITNLGAYEGTNVVAIEWSL